MFFLHLVNSKCIPILLYSLEVCLLNKADIRSLDFTVARVLMKLFRTSNTDIKDCCTHFKFKLPNELLPGKFEKSLSKLQRAILETIRNNGYRLRAGAPCVVRCLSAPCISARIRIQAWNNRRLCIFAFCPTHSCGKRTNEIYTCIVLGILPPFYPRDAMLARVFAKATCLSVCPSVRPSATRRYCA